MQNSDRSQKSPLRHEAEHEGPIWKHPYMLYVGLTIILFVVLLIIAWIAWTSGWIPSRGIG